LVLHNPGGHRSSCAFATAIENDKNHYSIDDLEESKECRLVTPILGIPRTVAYELARPLVEGTIFNSHPIPNGYALVLVDGVKRRHRRSKLEYTGENGEWKLRKNIGCHILWCKRDIEFGEEDFETSSSGSSPPQQQPLLPPPLEHPPLSPPPQEAGLSVEQLHGQSDIQMAYAPKAWEIGEPMVDEKCFDNNTQTRIFCQWYL
jgi:hypothetical protein